jgi:hypothetical protein
MLLQPNIDSGRTGIVMNLSQRRRILVDDFESWPCVRPFNAEFGKLSPQILSSC